MGKRTVVRRMLKVMKSDRERGREYGERDPEGYRL